MTCRFWRGDLAVVVVVLCCAVYFAFCLWRYGVVEYLRLLYCSSHRPVASASASRLRRSSFVGLWMAGWLDGRRCLSRQVALCTPSLSLLIYLRWPIATQTLLRLSPFLPSLPPPPPRYRDFHIQDVTQQIRIHPPVSPSASPSPPPPSPLPSPTPLPSYLAATLASSAAARPGSRECPSVGHIWGVVYCTVHSSGTTYVCSF